MKLDTRELATWYPCHGGGEYQLGARGRIVHKSCRLRCKLMSCLIPVRTKVCQFQLGLTRSRQVSRRVIEAQNITQPNQTIDLSDMEAPVKWFIDRVTCLAGKRENYAYFVIKTAIYHFHTIIWFRCPTKPYRHHERDEVGASIWVRKIWGIYERWAEVREGQRGVGPIFQDYKFACWLENGFDSNVNFDICFKQGCKDGIEVGVGGFGVHRVEVELLLIHSNFNGVQFVMIQSEKKCAPRFGAST